jgi:hypothetical protein
MLVITLKSAIVKTMKRGIENLISSGFGWITSHGEFYAVEQWKHFVEIAAIVEDSPFEYDDLSKCISGHTERIDSMRESCQETADREGNTHAEWHWYEMAGDDASEAIVKKAYESGWIRVGKNGMTGVEGTPQGIKARYSDIKKLQDNIGLDNPIDYYKVKRERALCRSCMRDLDLGFEYEDQEFVAAYKANEAWCQLCQMYSNTNVEWGTCMCS